MEKISSTGLCDQAEKCCLVFLAGGMIIMKMVMDSPGLTGEMVNVAVKVSLTVGTAMVFVVGFISIPDWGLQPRKRASRASSSPALVARNVSAA